MGYKRTSTKRKSPREKEIDECYRRMNIRGVSDADKMYYSGKIDRLRADLDSPWGFADLTNKAMELIQSDDNNKRARGFGMLYNDPVYGGAYDRATYTLKQ